MLEHVYVTKPFSSFFKNLRLMATMVHQILKSKVRNEIFTLTPEHAVIDALVLMAEENIGAVMVMDGTTLVGIFSERDYTRKGMIQGRKAK